MNISWLWFKQNNTNNSDVVKMVVQITILSVPAEGYSRKSLKISGGSQNTYIEEEQTTQWPKEKVQKDKQRSTKNTHKTKDRVTRTPLKTGDE